MSQLQSEIKDGLTLVVRSDIGMRRANNQDSYAVSFAADRRQRQQQGDLFLVADGMGAHAAGELASKMAADGIPHIYRKLRDMPPDEAMRSAIAEANLKIHQRGNANLDFRNMGTTCTSLLLLPQGAVVGHVGDSRAYRLRGTTIQQLSFDHSLAWEMRELNHLAEDDESLDSIPKNVITRSLGPSPSVKIDLEGPLPIEPNDQYLLCSDGLTGRVSDAEIAAALFYLEPSSAVETLIDLANVRGGTDNTTIITVSVGEAHGDSRVSVDSNGVIREKPSFWERLNTAFRSICGQDANFVENLAKPSGRAPYRTAKVLAAQKFAADLTQIVTAGRNAAEQRGWPVDWSSLLESLSLGEKLMGSGDHEQSFRQQAQSLHIFMEHCYQNLRERPLA